MPIQYFRKLCCVVSCLESYRRQRSIIRRGDLFTGSFQHSRRRQITDERQEYTELYKRLFQALSRTNDGAFIINEQHQIIFWNQAAQAILGYTAEEAASRQCYEVLGGRDEQGRALCQRYCRIAIGALQGKTLPTIDVHALTRDGEGRWINVTTFAVPAGDQELGHVIVHLFRDATQKKNNERFVEQIMVATRERRHENESPGFSITPAEFPPDPGLEALTPREWQVLLLLAQGLGTDEMASMLNISPATTRNHIQNILGKLSVHSRLEAVAYAYQQGLINIDDS